MKALLMATLAALIAAPVAGAFQAVELTPVKDDLQLVVSPDSNVVSGHNRYVIGFYELPMERESYHGHEVIRVNDAINFFVVVTDNPVLLRQQALLDESVRYVQWDPLRGNVLTMTPNDGLYNDPGHYGSKIIGAEAAWDRTLGSTSVIIGHIDSGLNKDHEEFAGSGRVLQGYDFINYDNEPEDEKGGLLYGCGYHGTHTTGTHAATINNGLGIAGLAQSTILPIKALGGGGVCSASETGLADALTYAADQGAHFTSNSWRFPDTTTVLLDALDYTHGKGTMIISAAGNNGPCTNCVESPWKLRADKVMIVASSDSSDKQSSFSSEGPEVDIIGPGSSIISSTASPDTYATYSGTSMATPHVAGVAALVKTLNPTWGTAEITNQLLSTAVDIGLSTDKQGAGRLNADGATGGSTTSPTYQCSDGLDNDGDGAIDYPADPGCTSDTDNDETDPVTSDSTMHVHNIDSWREGKSPLFQIWIYDSNEAAVSAATVSVEVCKSGGSCATGSADTGSDGSVTFKWRNAGSGTYTTCVTNVVKSGWTWDSAAGHASSGNCHTETV